MGATMGICRISTLPILSVHSARSVQERTLVVEQTIATLWAGVQVVPRLPKGAFPNSVLKKSLPFRSVFG